MVNKMLLPSNEFFFFYFYTLLLLFNRKFDVTMLHFGTTRILVLIACRVSCLSNSNDPTYLNITLNPGVGTTLGCCNSNDGNEV